MRAVKKHKNGHNSGPRASQGPNSTKMILPCPQMFLHAQAGSKLIKFGGFKKVLGGKKSEKKKNPSPIR